MDEEIELLLHKARGAWGGDWDSLNRRISTAMDQSYRNTQWEFKSDIKNRIFEDVDFTQTDLNHPIFTEVVFKNCRFEKTNFEDARVYSCSFVDCTFRKIKWSTATIGAHGGIYRNCTFDQCNFRGASIYNPEFLGCTFLNCRWKGVDLFASYFDSCVFTGKLEDVTFRGFFKNDLYPDAKPNPMRNVDFSEAVFGQFVSFIGCDLTTAIPPKGFSFDQLLERTGLIPDCISTGEHGMR